MRLQNFYPIIVTDKLVECRDFYVRFFDLEVAFEASWFVLMTADNGGRASLAFMRPEHPSAPPGPERFGGKGMCLEFQVEDAAAEHERFLRDGAPVSYALRDEAFGQRRFGLFDPAGVWIDVVQQIESAAGFWVAVPSRSLSENGIPQSSPDAHPRGGGAHQALRRAHRARCGVVHRRGGADPRRSVGPRGAGKTTCGDCLSGVITPDTGRIIFDGREFTGGDRHDLARAGLARTFQVAKVFPRLSAADNVAVDLGRHRFGRLAVMLRAWRRASTHPEALAILTRAGLADAADQPAGLLPLGMQKRLEVARALAGRPRLILLDEPFGGLSDAETGAMTELIATLRGDGLTVVLIEHRMDAAMGLADRAVVLDRGIVIASGAPERVRSDPKVIEAYGRERTRSSH